MSWVQERSLGKSKRATQVTQPDPGDPGARAAQPDPGEPGAQALTNTWASPTAQPAAPMALRNGEQMSHDNRSLPVATS